MMVANKGNVRFGGCLVLATDGVGCQPACAKVHRV
jgi:hypothetical protein